MATTCNVCVFTIRGDMNVASLLTFMYTLESCLHYSCLENWTHFAGAKLRLVTCRFEDHEFAFAQVASLQAPFERHPGLDCGGAVTARRGAFIFEPIPETPAFIISGRYECAVIL